MNFQINFILSVLVIGRSMENDCPSNSTFFFNDRCFWRLNGRWTFQEAHEKCQKDGGILAEIPDNETEIMLTSYWIGVNDVELEGEYVDMWNRTQNYTNWKGAQPNNKDKRNFNKGNKTDVQRCYVIDRDRNIADVDCFMKFSAFCSDPQMPFLEEKYMFREANNRCGMGEHNLMEVKN
ncbi:lectin BRA-3-like, partial [Saccostrea cucullata]|uniref:lectin BRA-3-like n=1 Tax=Saccostrea cuccullata TaxID=36930 RepID=UPI002ED035CD